MLNTFINYLIARAKRTPYFHLIVDGIPYMNRWHLIPMKKHRIVPFFSNPLFWLFQKLDISVRIHEILQSDSDRAFHDHPFDFITVILKGGYYEIMPIYDRSGVYRGNKKKWHGPGSILIRSAKTQHRLELSTDRFRHPFLGDYYPVDCVSQPVTTLFITGPRKQNWGFFPIQKFKIPSKEY